MGTLGGFIDINVFGAGGSTAGPVGLLVKDVFLNYAPLGVVPQPGTLLYGCMISTDDEGFERNHGCNVMHVYT